MRSRFAPFRDGDAEWLLSDPGESGTSLRTSMGVVRAGLAGGAVMRPVLPRSAWAGTTW